MTRGKLKLLWFYLAYTNYSKRCNITTKSDGNCSYKGDMSNNKVADCCKYVFRLIHLTSAEKERREDHMGGVILVRGSFVSAEASLLKGAKRDEEEGAVRGKRG